MNKLTLILMMAVTQLPSTRLFYDPNESSLPHPHGGYGLVQEHDPNGLIESWHTDPNSAEMSMEWYQGNVTEMWRIVPFGYEFDRLQVTDDGRDVYVVLIPRILKDDEIIVVDGQDVYYTEFSERTGGGRVLRKATDTAYIGGE